MTARMAAEPRTLAEALLPASGMDMRVLRAVVLVVFGSFLLALSARIQVPMWPVPMTMQTFAVLLIGAGYGWRLGGATVLAYLLEGGFGLPVFAGPATGFGYFAGTTGGYLIGFLLAALAMGWMVERGWDRTIGRLLATLAVGSIIPFVTGVGWLATLIGLEPAIANGLMPFIVGAMVKLGLAAAVIELGWRSLGRNSHSQ